jgi:membrane protease YdiL (CAAX protease family)
VKDTIEVQGEAKSRVPGKQGRIVHALVLIVIQALAFVFGVACVGRIVGLDTDNAFGGGRGALLVVTAIGMLQVVGVIGVGLLWWGRLTLRALGWRYDGFFDVVLGLGGLAAMVASALAVVVLSGGDVPALGQEVLGFTLPQRAQILLIGLFAAFTEETLFRGYLQPALIGKLGYATGILAGAGVFAVYHVPLTPRVSSLLAKFAYGLVLGFLRGRDRSLLRSSVAHFAFVQVMGFA